MLATSDLYHGLGVLVDDPGPDAGRWELEQITNVLQADGEPGLLIGSGNGGWLLELRSQALLVDGVDAALERIANCAQRASAAGVSVQLFWQPMQALDLPRRYRTIAIMNGALMHVTDSDQALDTLRRVYHHLQPGGQVLVSSPGWQPIDLSLAGREWRVDESLSCLSGGARLSVERRPLALDPVDLILTDERRYRLMAALGVSRVVGRQVERRIEDRFLVPWSKLSARHIAPRLEPPLLVVHDRDDADVP